MRPRIPDRFAHVFLEFAMGAIIIAGGALAGHAVFHTVRHFGIYVVAFPIGAYVCVRVGRFVMGEDW